MHLAPLRLATSIWILLGLYWVASGITLKPVARRERPAARAAHLGLMLVACVLLFNSRASLGPLATRFVPDADWTGWVGIGLTAAGCAFAVWGRALLGANWSATVTLKQGHELVRGGPYAWVRHPIYAGLLVAVLGTALVVGEVRALLAFAIAFAAWLEKARREERFLMDQFNGEYVEYSRSVKRLIPFLL
jgi:protein-S-isoprenylcysteine O-methyltransferase Ste14